MRGGSIASNFFVHVTVITLLLAVFSLPADAEETCSYTNDSDFDSGILVGVEHNTVHNQLQLSKKSVTLPFIWVPNYDGTVSKINTDTGQELGRYRIAPPGFPNGGNPSRTTVDLRGSCWVGNREAGTAVKIGLYETGECKDKNENGTIETSLDLNNDGNITGGEILAWGQDECVLFEVVLVPGHERAYSPGTYVGPYDTNYWGVSPRGLAVDSSNNIWIGTWSTSKFYHIDGETGTIKYVLDVSRWGHSSYGAVIDRNGILWSAKLNDHMLRINTSNLNDVMKIGLTHTYGIGLDGLGHLFVGGNGLLSKIDINAIVNPVLWTKNALTMRGVASTPDNDIWVTGYDAMWTYRGVSRYDNNGNLKKTISGFNSPSGVAVDHNGRVWVTDIGSEYIYRINPATNTIDLSKRIIGSGGHYTYSDMTGYVARTLTTKTGTWTVTCDSATGEAMWGRISWNSSDNDGVVTVRARSSEDQTNWSPWKDAVNGVPLTETIVGRFAQIEATLQLASGDNSPFLYDLTVEEYKAWYKDADNDNYSDGERAIALERPAGFKLSAELNSISGDCNDSNPSINPGAVETCDSIDNNCDGRIDEGVKNIYYRDADSDVYGDPATSVDSCSAPTGYVSNNTDCNDSDPKEHPNQTWYKDTDNDGFSNGTKRISCTRPAGHKVAEELRAISGDCNDSNASINPAALEICDGLDNDCDGQIDEDVKKTFYRDADGDGFGNPGIQVQSCAAPSGYVLDNGDCDDNDPKEHPNQTWYKDSDNDGFSDGTTAISCVRPNGYKTIDELKAPAGDCDDANASVYSGAREKCDCRDNNCNGRVDEPNPDSFIWLCLCIKSPNPGFDLGLDSGVDGGFSY